MRLIDADALNKELQKRVGSPTNDKLYEVNLCIINAPTIDAIPVEWLNQKYAENEPGEDKEYDYFLWNAIAYILTEWQKEQEAR